MRSPMRRGTSMRSYAIDFYHKGMAPQSVDMDRYERLLPDSAVGSRLQHLEGKLSSFVKVHVDTWLTLGAACAKGDKQGQGIFGILKTGDSGHDSSYLVWLDLPITDNRIYVNYWAHNMLDAPFDWHGGYVIYYE